MDEIRALIGQRIRQRLDELGMQQNELAIKTGLTEAAISRYISGQRTPNLANAKRIADALYVDMGWLVGETHAEYNEMIDKNKLLKQLKTLEQFNNANVPEWVISTIQGMPEKGEKMRDCENCKYHTDGGCTKWDCEYEKREEE